MGIRVNLGVWDWVFISLFLLLFFMFLRGVMSTKPFTRFLGATGLYVLAFTMLGIVLGYNDANFWQDQSGDKYFFAMALLFVAIIMVCVAVISLMQAGLSQGNVIFLILIGTIYAYTAAWLVAWMLFNDWGGRFMRGEENATVDLWRFHDVKISVTVAGAIAMVFLMIAVFIYAILNARYRVSITRGIRRIV